MSAAEESVRAAHTTVDELYAQVRKQAAARSEHNTESRRIADVYADAAGRAIAELVDLCGVKFEDVVTHTGIPTGTAFRWSKPFRVGEK